MTPKNKKPPTYMGNNPGSANYDPNLPVGNNKWDEEEALSDLERWRDRDNGEEDDEWDWDGNTEQDFD